MGINKTTFIHQGSTLARRLQTRIDQVAHYRAMGDPFIWGCGVQRFTEGVMSDAERICNGLRQLQQQIQMQQQQLHQILGFVQRLTQWSSGQPVSW